MANPPADGMSDDFFDQIFSMPTAYATAGDGGSPGCGDSSSFPSAAGFGDGGPSIFSLGLSLHQQVGGGGGVQLKNTGGDLIRDEDEGNRSSSVAETGHLVPLARLFSPYGHSQAHQIRLNPSPQVLHEQAIQSPMAVVPQQLAPRPKIRARRGQATDPHSIAERLRREKIAEKIRALQELVPSTNKTDRAAMLDEIIDYVKFLRLQVKVLSMSRLGGAGDVTQLVADIPLSPVEGDGSEGRTMHQVWDKWATDGTERQVAKLMEGDIGAAMQFLQAKALCIMPISLAAAVYQTHPQPEPLLKPEPNTAS